MSIYDPYKKHGLTRVINASTSLTRLGGSMPDPRVYEAMVDAGKAFVNIPELQAWAGAEIAEMIGAEAALPTAGATASLTLAVAACIMKGTDLENFDPLQPDRWDHLTRVIPQRTGGMRREFIIQANNRDSYDFSVECGGGRLVEAGGKEGASRRDLLYAFDPDKTAGFYYVVKPFQNLLSLKEVADVANGLGLPLIVDAAPYLTHSNIPGKLLGDGADLLVFSGGKQLGGPNNSGILAGRRDLVKLAHLQSYPFDGVGRGAKMSRETIVGLVKALELFMQRDDAAYYSAMEERTVRLSEGLDKIPGVVSGVLHEPRVLKDEAGACYAYVELDESAACSLAELHQGLKKGDPPIEALFEPFFITTEATNRVTFKVEYLLDGDDRIILDRVNELVTG